MDRPRSRAPHAHSHVSASAFPKNVEQAEEAQTPRASDFVPDEFAYGLSPELLRSLTQLAARLTQDHADAEDLVQTAIMRMLERSSDLPADWNTRAWLYTVIRRLAIDRSRHQQRWREVELQDELEAALPTVMSEDADVPRWSKLEAPQIERALAHCRPEYRAVFDLYSNEGLAYHGIAGRLGLPLGTVATRLRRARHQIRRELEHVLVE